MTAEAGLHALGGDDRSKAPAWANDDGPPPPPLEAYVEELERGDDRQAAPRQPSATYIRPEMPRRIEAIKSALLPLDAIEAVLECRYLVKGWLDRGTISDLYGESNVGKTFFALDLAFHVAAGMDWRGHRVRAGGDGRGDDVVYVAAEGGTGIRNRIAAFRREYPEVAAKAAGRFYLLPVTLNLCGDEDADAVLRALEDLGVRPVLVIIDTLARSMGDGDESTAQDMGKFVRSMDRIRAETGAHVMAIHHSGKDASRGARGSYSLKAAVDTEIALTRDGMVMTATAQKQRDMATGGTFSFSLRSITLGVDEDGDQVTSCVVEPTDPLPKKPKLSGQQEIAYQALSEAIAEKGEKIGTDRFPQNREVVSLAVWRRYCERHSLSNGESECAFRKAFNTVKNALHKKGVIRIVDDFVWVC